MEAEDTMVRKPMSAPINGTPIMTLLIRYFEEIGGGTHLAMLKTMCAPDTLSLKPGSGATEGVPN